MSTQFANTLNNHPIYADRAEKDAAGNTITTTYQEKLTAGTGITIDSSNVISATGGGGGGTYTAGDGISIVSDVIAADVDGSTIGIDASTKKIKLLSIIPTVPSAGNMLSVTNSTLNVTTTAGITDIQVVNALPANPVATVMYCIPVT